MKWLGIWILAMVILVSVSWAKIGGGDIKYEIKRVGNVIFSHDTHVEAMGFNCMGCHPVTFVTQEQGQKDKMIHRRQSQSCGMCHNGKQAFDLRSNCYICHQREVK